MKERRTGAGEPILDVLIMGGGQSGLVLAFGLMRERVQNILVVDQNKRGYAGPWKTFARMITLRTPNHLTGVDLGIPHLTFQTWYESQHGIGSWEALDLIPKEMWANYLNWYREFLGIPVACSTRAGAVQWDPDESCFQVPLSGPDGDKFVYARRVVLATGIDGSGVWKVPNMVSASLADSRYSHTRDEIDFDALKGKRIAVLGAGASAFDNASVALESGAASVDLFFRRKRLPNVNAYRWAENVGYLRHHADLSDEKRWQFIRQIIRMGQLPPTDTFRRATEYSNFKMHPGSGWKSVTDTDTGVMIETTKGHFEVDFVICGTGFRTDLSQRVELGHCHQDISLWADRFTPDDGDSNEDLLRHPYLGPGFEFVPKDPEIHPWISNIYNYTFGCLLSLGFGGASISGMKYSIPRIVGALTGSFYREDADEHFQSLAGFSAEEFSVDDMGGDE